MDEASPLAANYRAMLEVKEKEIEQLRSQAEASDRQLKIQTKVDTLTARSGSFLADKRNSR